MAITAVVAGAPSETVGTDPSTTPALPTGCTTADLLIIFDVVVTQGGTPATPATPSGWTQRTTFASGDVRITWFYRTWVSGLTAPTITVTGASATQHRSTMSRVRGGKLSGDPTDVLGAASGGASTTTGLGPVTGLTSAAAGGAVLVGAALGNDLTNSTSVGGLTQSGLTFTMLDSWGGVSTDNYAGALSAALLTSATSVTAKTYPIDANVDTYAGQMWALNPEPGGGTTTTVVEDFEDTTYAVPISGTWTRTSATANTGSWSLRSAVIGHSATTDAVVTVPAGATAMQFAFRVSSESGFDFFRIFIDAAQVGETSGLGTWTASPAYDVTGASTVTFRYVKDVSVVAGDDAAYIDDLTFTVPAGAGRPPRRPIDRYRHLLVR